MHARPHTSIGKSVKVQQSLLTGAIKLAQSLHTNAYNEALYSGICIYDVFLLHDNLKFHTAQTIWKLVY